MYVLLVRLKFRGTGGDYLDERELVKKAQEGSKHAMNILLTSNYKALYGFTLKMTANEELSLDIVQDVCLKAVEHINKFKGGSKFQTWLIAMAVNRYKDLLRKDKKVKFVNSEDLNLLSKDDNDKILEKMQIQQLLLELNKMPYEKRISFILKHYYGYSYEEISNILGCSEGTVKSRIFYTIKKLRQSLIGGENSNA